MKDKVAILATLLIAVVVTKGVGSHDDSYMAEGPRLRPDGADYMAPHPGLFGLPVSGSVLLSMEPVQARDETEMPAQLPRVPTREEQLGRCLEAESYVTCVISAYFGPDTGAAYRVVRYCEDKELEPGQVGDAGERGLFQIHSVHLERIERLGWTWEDMLEVVPNVAVAYDLWLDMGWEPWSCSQWALPIRAW